jgi:cation transport regulator ChaC
MRIIACYPRAVRGLFRAARAPLSEEVEILNMREQSATEISERVLVEAETALVGSGK